MEKEKFDFATHENEKEKWGTSTDKQRFNLMLLLHEHKTLRTLSWKIDFVSLTRVTLRQPCFLEQETNGTVGWRATAF